MKKSIVRRIYFTIIMLILFLFLLPTGYIKAEFETGLFTNDNKPNPTIDQVNNNSGFKLTTFGGSGLATGVPVSDCKKDPKYGWYVYTYNGEDYVVLAGASYALFDNPGTSYYPYTWHDYIHYFHIDAKYGSNYETIQFKFKYPEKINNDTTVYNGIFLDKCAQSMIVEKDEPQILDVFFGPDGEGVGSIVNQQEVIVTSTGTFSSNAGTTSSASNLSVILDALSLFFTTIGDIVQTSLESVAEGINWLDCKQLLYTRQEIEADEALNKKIRVRDARERDRFLEGSMQNVSKRISISNTETDKNGNETVIFTPDTKIPVVAMDMYSLATGESDLFDINFYNANYESENNHAFWKFIRGIVVTFSKIVMYISAAALLTLLIYRAIMLVFSTVSDNPRTAALSKEVMDDFVKAIALVAGSVAIIAVSTHFYTYIQDIIINGKDTNYTIRLNVENVYMFDTNIMGYIKYMTLRTSSWSKLGYSIIYALMAIFCNFAIFLAMFFRMLGIGFLVVIAPLTAVGTLSKKSIGGDGIGKLLNFKVWIKTYFTLLLLPLGFIFAYKIILLLW